MSVLSILPRRPICLNCIRRGVGDDVNQFLRPSLTQVRGKKKTTQKPDTINVRLLIDMKGYGRRGAITPVAPGRMRNAWYPRQQAEYVSTLRDIDPKTVLAERDFSYGMQDLKTKETSNPAYDPVTLGPLPRAQTKLLTPQIATEILSNTLPPHLIFYRTAIVEPEPEKSPDPLQPYSRRAASQAAQETYEASETAPVAPSSKTKLQTIFGSVSTTDMADSIRALLANGEDSKRVVIGPEDIAIIGNPSEGVEGDRLKAMGNFKVEIRVKGGEGVQRTVSVKTPGT